jgi:hypothetical protein
MQRKKQVQDAAARQMEALRRHRAEREAAAKIAQSARLENPNMYINNSNMEKPTSSLQNSDEALLLAEHEARWDEIEAAAASINTLIPLITYATLPWPPFGDNLHKYLLALTSNNISASAEDDDDNESSGTSSRDLRRAYTRACLRWHPDKFLHRFSRLVHEEEFEAIMAMVQEVAQGINQAYQELR